VHVHQPAQKTDGYQLSRALLLSEGAEMDTKPELEIYADDVKCSHGATTGQLDQEPLFYMQSRGIDEKSAKALLIQAFVAEVFDNIQDESLKISLERRVEAWLKQ
jgi:Fe-S cluster assembly protein SufD